MDFGRLLAQSASTAAIEPRELYASLPNKADGYGYLRDVQAQLLSKWRARRGERDLIIKVNTGAGKTIDGLVILQSYLNEGEGPELYVAPNTKRGGGCGSRSARSQSTVRNSLAGTPSAAARSNKRS